MNKVRPKSDADQIVPDGILRLDLKRLETSVEAQAAIEGTVLAWSAEVGRAEVGQALETEHGRLLREGSAEDDRLCNRVNAAFERWMALADAIGQWRGKFMRWSEDLAEFQDAVIQVQRCQNPIVRKRFAGLLRPDSFRVGHVVDNSASNAVVGYLTAAFNALLQAEAKHEPVKPPALSEHSGRSPDSLDDKDLAILAALVEARKQAKEILRHPSLDRLKPETVRSRMRKLKRLGLVEGAKPYGITENGRARLREDCPERT